MTDILQVIDAMFTRRWHVTATVESQDLTYDCWDLCRVIRLHDALVEVCELLGLVTDICQLQ